MSYEKYISVKKAGIIINGNFSKWSFDPIETIEEKINIPLTSNPHIAEGRYTTEIVLSLRINQDGAPRGLLGGRFEVIGEQVVWLEAGFGGHKAEQLDMVVGIPVTMKSVIRDEIINVVSNDLSHDLITPSKIQLKYGMYEKNYYDETAYRLLMRCLLYVFNLRTLGITDKNEYERYIEKAYLEIQKST